MLFKSENLNAVPIIEKIILVIYIGYGHLLGSHTL